MKCSWIPSSINKQSKIISLIYFEPIVVVQKTRAILLWINIRSSPILSSHNLVISLYRSPLLHYPYQIHLPASLVVPSIELLETCHRIGNINQIKIYKIKKIKN